MRRSTLDLSREGRVLPSPGAPCLRALSCPWGFPVRASSRPPGGSLTPHPGLRPAPPSFAQPLVRAADSGQAAPTSPARGTRPPPMAAGCGMDCGPLGGGAVGGGVDGGADVGARRPGSAPVSTLGREGALKEGAVGRRVGTARRGSGAGVGRTSAGEGARGAGVRRGRPGGARSGPERCGCWADRCGCTGRGRCTCASDDHRVQWRGVQPGGLSVHVMESAFGRGWRGSK